jgi:acid phosphatase
MKSSIATLLATASLTYAQTATEKEPSLSAIESAAASIKPYSPVSNVEGVAFNRFFQVWLENIVCDYLINQKISVQS